MRKDRANMARTVFRGNWSNSQKLSSELRNFGVLQAMGKSGDEQFTCGSLFNRLNDCTKLKSEFHEFIYMIF